MERRNDLLRLHVDDFQALQASKVDLIVQRQDAIELWVVGGSVLAVLLVASSDALHQWSQLFSSPHP